MLRLSRRFPVVWIDRAEPWQRHALRKRPVAALTEQDRKIAGSGKFFIHDGGRLLGEYYRPAWLARWACSRRINLAIRQLRRAGCRQMVLYLWRPDFEHALDAHPWSMTLYHIDDEYSFSEQHTQLSARERRVIEKADQVVVHSTSLLANKGGINPRTDLVPNGVDFAAFTTPHDEPADLAPVPWPRLGYVGLIKKQLDLELLYDVARAHPGASLVLVGPVVRDHDIEVQLDKLLALDNVWLLGPKSPHDLPAYTQHLSIGLLPYRVNAYTNAIYPLKLHEYLACGLPVLATPIATVQTFASIIRIENGATAWSRAIDSMLQDTQSARTGCTHGRSIAAQHDWNVITDRIAQLIHDGIRQRATDRPLLA